MPSRNPYITSSSDEGGRPARRGRTARSPSPSPRGRRRSPSPVARRGRTSSRRRSPSPPPRRGRRTGTPSYSPEPRSSRRGGGRSSGRSGSRRRSRDSGSGSDSDSDASANGSGQWRDDTKGSKRGGSNSGRGRGSSTAQRSKSLERQLRASLADTSRDGHTKAEALVHSLQDADRAAHGRIVGRLGVRAVIECMEEHGLIGAGAGSGGGAGGRKDAKRSGGGAGKAVIEALLPKSVHARDSSGRVNYVAFLRRFGVDAPRVVGVRMLQLLLGSSAAAAQAAAQLQAADSRANGRVTGVLRHAVALEALQSVAPGMTAEQISAAISCFPAGGKAHKSSNGSADGSAAAAAAAVAVDYGLMLRAHARHVQGGAAARTRGSVAEWLEAEAAPVERRNFDELMGMLAAYEQKRGLRGAGGHAAAADGSVTLALGPRLRVTMQFHME